MTVFWLVAALFLLGALLMVLPSLLQPRAAGVGAGSANLAVHRHQWREAEADLAAGLIAPELFAQARSEIQRRVLEDTDHAEADTSVQPARRTALALALLIPLGSVLTYLQLGQPQAVAPVSEPAVASTDRHSVTPEQIQKLATALGERLKTHPADAEGWLMLARSYTALGRYRDAATAFGHAAELLPGNANVLTDQADLLGMAQNKRLAGEPARLVQRALDIDPRHVKALALAGSVAFEARDYAAARSYWQRLLAVLPAQAPMVRSIQGSLAEAARLESGTGAGPAQTDGGSQPGGEPSAAQAGSDSSAVSGQVVVSAELAGHIAPGDTVFVFARAAQGPRMPLAILRRPADGKPLAFSLDDSMAMAPNLKLSNFSAVVVSARISRSGNATPQTGDLVGQSEAVRPGTPGLRIVIDRVQP